MTIRNATEEDILDILEIGKLMHTETTYSKYDFDEDKVAELLFTLIEHEAGIAIVSVAPGGELHGGFIGSVHPQWFGSDLQATDYALFLKPEYRGAQIATPLLSEFIKQAKEKGAKQILLSTTAGYKPEDVAKLYEHVGFTKIGFIHEWQI